MSDASSGWSKAAEQFAAAMSRGDLDLADTLLAELEGPQPKEIVQLISHLHLRRERWLDASKVADQFPLDRVGNKMRNEVARQLAAMRVTDPTKFQTKISQRPRS